MGCAWMGCMKPQGHGLKETPFAVSKGLEWRHEAVTEH